MVAEHLGSEGKDLRKGARAMSMMNKVYRQPFLRLGVLTASTNLHMTWILCNLDEVGNCWTGEIEDAVCTTSDVFF